MNGPVAVGGDGTQLFVADSGNNRVLIYHDVSSLALGAAADAALGQSLLTTGSGATTAGGFSNPTGIHSDGTRLWVTDTYNMRVVAWNQSPSTSTNADFALGHPPGAKNLTSNLNYYGAWVTSASARAPQDVFSDGTRLFVVDTFDNRVLVWNTMPTSDAQPADFAIGEPDLVTPWAGCSPTTVTNPRGVYSDGTRLYVADTNNARVLVWNTMPTASGTPASFALGQTNLNSCSQNRGGSVASSSMSYPMQVYSDGTHLFVADYGNHRVLVWNSLDLASGGDTPADVCLGQTDCMHGSANAGGAAAGNTLKSPTGVYSDGSNGLYVADGGNSRVLVWHTVPTSGTAAATLVLGQTSMSGTSSALTATGMGLVQRVFSAAGRLFVSDGQNRVLMWSAIPTMNGAAADGVFGQPDLQSGSANAGGLSASTLSGPSGVYSDGTRLFVADVNNNRVVVLPIYSP